MTEAVANLTTELGSTPLIGFAGGPFTLASYLVDGGPSKNFEITKSLMYGQPELWADLMRRLADITIGFLQVQVAAGASAVQLFDSWAGALSQDDYRSCVLPHSKRIFDALAASGVPRIHFGVSTGELLGPMGEAGADVVGVDWRVPLDEAVSRVEPGKALQGNLDPAILMAPWHVIEERARRGARPRPDRGGPHLQPRAWRAAADRSGCAGQADRAGAHSVGAISLTAPARWPAVSLLAVGPGPRRMRRTMRRLPA